MAERLPAYDFGQRFRTTGRRGHPWEEWLDGNPWRLTRGVDFDSTIVNFRDGVHRAASTRGVRAITRQESDDVIVIQAVPA